MPLLLFCFSHSCCISLPAIAYGSYNFPEVLETDPDFRAVNLESLTTPGRFDRIELDCLQRRIGTFGWQWRWLGKLVF